MSEHLEASFKEAAKLIAKADFILVAAGAGFSADSGLPVYKDIADVAAYEDLGLDYRDLCDPYWLEEDKDIFYGFWGVCFNEYRDTLHHSGYEILSSWKEALVKRTQADPSRFQETLAQLRQSGSLPIHDAFDEATVTKSPFFIYTSNVDAHFHRTFHESEIYEIHGNIETWQCAGSFDGITRPCEIAPWCAPRDFRFSVNSHTMRALLGLEAASTSFLSCPNCRKSARPNILMFHDKNWTRNSHREDAYMAWEGVMEQLIESDPTLSVIVLEIGCGTRVPSVRQECEVVIDDLFERCKNRDQLRLIRINPDFPFGDSEVIKNSGLILPIASTGLRALESIDFHLKSML